MRERLLSAHELLTWAEACTVATAAHPHPWPGWNFSERFPGMPFAYRRSVIKDAIGKVRSYLSNRAKWEKSKKQQGKPGLPRPPITPRSTRDASHSIWRRSISKRPLCASMSTPQRDGAGCSTRSLQSLPRAAAQRSGLAAPEPYAGLAGTHRRTAHSPGEKDQSQQGDGAQAGPRSGHGGRRSQCEEPGGDYGQAAWQDHQDGVCDRSWPGRSPLPPSAGALPRSSGSRANRSKASTATSSSGVMSIA